MLEILQIWLHRFYKLICQKSQKVIIVLIYYLVEVEPIKFIVTDIYKFFLVKLVEVLVFSFFFLIDLLSFKAFGGFFFFNFQLKFL